MTNLSSTTATFSSVFSLALDGAEADDGFANGAYATWHKEQFYLRVVAEMASKIM
jgi:hypothetical protein